MNKIQIQEDSGLVLSTKEVFMRDYAISRCNEKFENVKSIKKIVEMNEPSISLVKKQFGKDFVQAYIATWIVNINGFLNLRFPMSETQIEETSRLIINNFYNLTIADIYLVINNAKMGLYGKFYDRIDGSMILSWFGKYFDERCNEFEQLSIHESEVMKKGFNFNNQGVKQ